MADLPCSQANGRPCYLMSNSPFLTPWTKASHSAGVKERVGLDASLVSRTSTAASPTFTATHVLMGRNLVIDEVWNPSLAWGFRSTGDDDSIAFSFSREVLKNSCEVQVYSRYILP